MIREKYPPIPATWPFDGNPPALGWIYALISYAALMLIFVPQDALPTHIRPAANWAASIERWFAFATSILFPLALGGAGVSYIRYRRRLLKRGETAVSRPWRSRVEVRFLLYLYAAVVVVGVVPTLLEVSPPTDDPDANFTQ